MSRLSLPRASIAVTSWGFLLHTLDTCLPYVHVPRRSASACNVLVDDRHTTSMLYLLFSRKRLRFGKLHRAANGESQGERAKFRGEMITRRCANARTNSTGYIDVVGDSWLIMITTCCKFPRACLVWLACEWMNKGQFFIGSIKRGSSCCKSWRWRGMKYGRVSFLVIVRTIEWKNAWNAEMSIGNDCNSVISERYLSRWLLRRYGAMNGN